MKADSSLDDLIPSMDEFSNPETVVVALNKMKQFMKDTENGLLVKDTLIMTHHYLITTRTFLINTWDMSITQYPESLLELSI